MNHSSNSHSEPSSFMGLTVLAAVLTFAFYPLTLAGIGEYSNGGALGIGSLSIALVASWSAFARNIHFPKSRMSIQLPLTALITFLTIREALCQYLTGHWFWF